MTKATPFELYAFWRTSATFRVRVAIYLKGLDVPEQFINLDAGEQASESFLKINPLGAIPALVQPGQAPLTQSLAILEYLDELYPRPALLPKDKYERARVRMLAQMLASDTHPLITPRIKKYLTTSGGFDEAGWRRWQHQWFGAGLRAVEQRLAADGMTGTFCHGDKVGLADICLASVMAVVRVFKIEVADIPTIDRIMARCDKHPAFRRADPMIQTGAPPISE